MILSLVGSTTVPSVDTISPLTSTRPSSIKSSHCRRLPNPAAASRRCNRCGPSRSLFLMLAFFLAAFFFVAFFFTAGLPSDATRAVDFFADRGPEFRGPADRDDLDCRLGDMVIRWIKVVRRSGSLDCNKPTREFWAGDAIETTEESFGEQTSLPWSGFSPPISLASCHQSDRWFTANAWL